MADLLNQLLAGHAGKSLDVATAYFNIQGFRLLQAGLDHLGSFRLLLGDEPEEGAAIGLRPKEPKIVRGLWGDIEKAPFTEETLRTVEDLIAFQRLGPVPTGRGDRWIKQFHFTWAHYQQRIEPFP